MPDKHVQLKEFGVDPRGLRTLTEQSPDVIMVLDLDCRILFINWTVPALTVEEVQGKYVYDFLPPECHEPTRACYEKVKRTRQAGIYRSVYERDGQSWEWESRVAPIDRDGEVVGFTVFSRDVTERNIRAIEVDRFFELSLDFLCIANDEGYFTRLNPSFARVLGYTEEELLARPFVDFVHPDDVEATTRVAAQIAEGHELVGFENRYRTKDGRYRLLAWQACRDKQRQRILGVARDITEQRKLEVQLRQSQKMDAVGQLAGGIAHDFNNLMLAVLVNAEFAQEALGAHEHEARDHLEEIERAGKRAATLTRRLLTFSQPAPLSTRAVDVNAIARDIINMLRRLIPENIRLEFDAATELPCVAADPVQIDQILMNLCVNARDAMAQGGRLTVQTRQVQIDDAFRENDPTAPPGHYVLLMVSDTGHGITPEVKSRLFEPFFTTKKLGEGTGIGLATVYAITKQHGGLIRVDSEPGQGATFEVYLPVSSAEGPRDTDAPRGGEPPTRGETILVAEDEQQVRDVIVGMLRRAGYRVLTAANGREAVELLAANVDDVQLAVLDVVMPVLSGPAAYQGLIEIKPDLPVVFSSGYIDSDRHGAAIPDGSRILAKPYATEQLLTAVREALGGH